MWARESKVALMLQIDSEQQPSFESLESFLSYFELNKFDFNSTFSMDSAEDLQQFLMKYSAPNQSESIAFLKSALIILLLHPAILKGNKKKNFPALRSILLQVIGRCVRRAQRAQVKTLPITVPLLLPHLPDPSLLKLIVDDLHLDLKERFKKHSADISRLYNDPLAANWLIVFDFLYLVNESFWAMSYTGKIEPSAFYHEFPVETFDVCEDYARWRESNRGNDGHLPFSFCDYPWIFNLEAKRTLLAASNGLKQRHHLQDAFFRAVFDGVQSTTLNLCVRRGEYLLKDARDQLLRLPTFQLAKQLKVSFQGEDGIDEGGLKKEFFQLCWDKIFSSEASKSQYFKSLSHESSIFWFNPSEIEDDLNVYEFVGLLLALAIYNGVLVAPRFPLLLFKKLLNWPLQFDDYAEIDPILFRSVNQLASDPEMLNEMELYHVAPDNLEIELIPNGANIPVTKNNLLDYFSLLSDYLLNTANQEKFGAFRSGFELVSEGSVLYGYRPEELFALAYGSDQFEISDLQAIASYEGGYSPNSPQIIWLWQVLREEFGKREQGQFLAFVTGSARAPLGGLLGLKSFTITRNTCESDRLPSAHTCFNTLLLPEYPSKSALYEKLALAIQHNQGFGLI